MQGELHSIYWSSCKSIILVALMSYAYDARDLSSKPLIPLKRSVMLLGSVESEMRFVQIPPIVIFRDIDVLLQNPKLVLNAIK